MCDITVEMYGCKVVVAMLVVAGQSEDLILLYLGEEHSKALNAEELANKNLLSSISGVVVREHVGD